MAEGLRGTCSETFQHHSESTNRTKASFQLLYMEPGLNVGVPTETHLPGVIVLHLPAAGQLQLLVGEHVEEGDEVPVVLVALEVVSVSTHLTDHVLQAGVARKHAVGTLDKDDGREGQLFRKRPVQHTQSSHTTLCSSKTHDQENKEPQETREQL